MPQAADGEEGEQATRWRSRGAETHASRPRSHRDTTYRPWWLRMSTSSAPSTLGRRSSPDDQTARPRCRWSRAASPACRPRRNGTGQRRGTTPHSATRRGRPTLPLNDAGLRSSWRWLPRTSIEPVRRLLIDRVDLEVGDMPATLMNRDNITDRDDVGSIVRNEEPSPPSGRHPCSKGEAREDERRRFGLNCRRPHARNLRVRVGHRRPSGASALLCPEPPDLACKRERA